ncbi:hypothetical protein QBC38DRAFT_344323, partial [Podospora fimiseda]
IITMELRIPSVVIILLLSSRALGQNNIDPSKLPTFLFPGKAQSNEIYHTKDTLLVKYASFFDKGDLFTFCEHGVGRFITSQNVPGFNATVPIKLNFTSPDPCWLNLRTGPGGLYGVNTYLFNVLPEERPGGPRTFRIEDSPATSSASISASTSASVSTTITTDSVKTDPTTSSFKSVPTSFTSNTPPSIETGAITVPAVTKESTTLPPAALIAIGCVIGIVLFCLVAAGYIVWRRRRK